MMFEIWVRIPFSLKFNKTNVDANRTTNFWKFQRILYQVKDYLPVHPKIKTERLWQHIHLQNFNTDLFVVALVNQRFD